MIIKVDRTFYLKDHPLRIWHKGDASTVKIRRWSKCCDGGGEILNAGGAEIDRQGKLRLYVIDPNEIDYGSMATEVEWRFCPSCGKEIEIVDNDGS